ncbi:uncharacterized protein LOC128251987 [Drosophila gunungcola]|uniref:uncharacterized protein LOC128251987 n=1 Tax=Drosophila gunungcola TaxID=103775 RepID=UPI0022E5A790|nr:uncharacterized protein LOC128251987 [Drosophila gunungcola]
MRSTRHGRRSLGIWSGLIAILCLNEIALDIELVSAVAYYTEKPAFLPSCRIYEPGFTKCSTNSIQKLLDQLNIGIPEVVERFGPFDPMRVRDIVFKQDNNEVATIRANLTELVVKGFSKTQVKESRVSKKDFGWQTKIFLPKMRLDGKYEMAGRILLIPLSGSGKIFIEIDDLDILLLTKTRLYEKGGFTFDNVTAVRAQLNLTKVRTYLDNLFNGRSKEVERSTNQFFNDNWRDFYEALKPLIVETVENILYDVMGTVFHLIPANFFVEDIPTPQQLYGPKKADVTKNSQLATMYIIGLLMLLHAGLKGVQCVAFYTEKPSYIESCRIYEPEFTKCSTRSIQAFMNQLVKGVPELDESFGPIDPMRQDQLVFKQDNSDVATISANLTDMLISGFGKMVIKESKVSKKDFSWLTKIYLPKMRMDGHYKMLGRILLVPLQGAGKIVMEIDDLDILMSTKTRLHEKGGFTFYNVTSVKVKLEVGKVRTKMDNLFNGQSKEVEKSTNQFFNDNWQDVFEALRPLVDETVERTLLDLLHKTFSLFPASFFVEDIPTSLTLYGRKSHMIA